MNIKKISIILFLIACTTLSLNKLWAQTPGGVIGVQIEYWLRADEVQATLPIDGADITTWQDLSGNARDFHSPTIYNPKFNKLSMNFHSSVDFYYLDSDDGGPSTSHNRERKLQTTTDFAPDGSKSYFVNLIKIILVAMLQYLV
mgnify:CR=1 FL=1